MQNSSSLNDFISNAWTNCQRQWKAQLESVPENYYLPICGSLVCIFALIVSKTGFINVVHYHEAQNPIIFKSMKNEFTLHQMIDKKVPSFKNHAWTIFNPFLFTGDLQTMFAGIRKFRFRDRLYFGRQIMRMPDGGSAALDKVIPEEQYQSYRSVPDDIPQGQSVLKINGCTRYLTKDEIENQDNDHKPIIVALHGLSGSSAEAYCRCLLRRLYQNEGFDCFVLNSRGCGNASITTPSLFCALWTEDIRQTIKFLRMKYPNRPIFAVGFSLGSIVLTNYLAQEGDHSGIDFAVTLACIWDLRASNYRMESHFISGNIYNPVMTVPLLRLISRHKKWLLRNKAFAKNYNWKTIKGTHCLATFDDNFTSQIFGFKCADEYYMNASPIGRIDNIRTPLLNVNAEDDPVAGGFDVGALPTRLASFNPYITMITTTHGGHLGWFNLTNTRWYADPVSKLLGNLYKDHFAKNGEVIVDKSSLPQPPPVNNGRIIL